MPANLTLGVCFSSELPLLPLLPPLCYITTTTSLSTHTATRHVLSQQVLAIVSGNTSPCPRMPTRILGQAYEASYRFLPVLPTPLHNNSLLVRDYSLPIRTATTTYAHAHTHTHRTTIYKQYYVDSMWTTRASLPLDIVSTISPGPPTCTHTTSDLLFRLMGSYIQLPKTQNTNTH